MKGGHDTKRGGQRSKRREEPGRKPFPRGQNSIPNYKNRIRQTKPWFSKEIKHQRFSFPRLSGYPFYLKFYPPEELTYVHRIPLCKNYETPKGGTCTCEDAIQSRRGTYKSTKTRRGGTRTGTTPGNTEELDYAHTSFTLTGARTKEHYFLV